MKFKQLSLLLENKPGALSAPCKLLADHAINLEALSVADTKFFGVLRILVKNWREAKELLEDNGYTVKVNEVVVLEVNHQAGSLAKILQIIDQEGLNVEYMYACPASATGKAALVFRFDDPDRAEEKLAANDQITLLEMDKIFL